MCHIEVPVDLFEASILVTEVAAFAILTIFVTVELPTILRLVFVINPGLFLFVQIKKVVLAKLLLAMSILAKIVIRAETSLLPVQTQFSLVHGALDETFRAIVNLHKAVNTTSIKLCGCWAALVLLLLELLLLWKFDGRDVDGSRRVLNICRAKWDVSTLNAHALERVRL